jgi:hypothetical protein
MDDIQSGFNRFGKPRQIAQSPVAARQTRMPNDVRNHQARSDIFVRPQRSQTFPIV